MNYYITFVKLPNVYIRVRAGNKSQAISHVSKYRNDAIATGEDEPRFNFREAEGFLAKWTEVHIDYLTANSNTRKKFKLTKPNGSVEYVEMRDDELESTLKKDYPRGHFFSVQGQRFFTVRKGKEVVPICSIQGVRSIPKLLEDKTPKEYTEVEAEVV